ncbi:MAG: sigma-70 family RNA polymerase sigma factor [candidate division Zixibacteria bacterium]|nr:sigma-70 family RNA polymerase sigma factor [candidate division Zixibacteria bacterium]
MIDEAREELERLVERAVDGDKDAFSALVRQLMTQVAAVAYRMTGDRESARDLAQETFLSAWQNIRSYRREAGFTSWLYRIAVNKTLNFLKANRRLVVSDEVVIQEADRQGSAITPEEELSRRDLADGVLAFMATLPPQQRMIFNLRFYSQMSFDEIATVTGRALGTVKTGYREAVSKLRDHAREKGWKS